MLDWPVCSPDLSPVKNVCRIMKRRIRQRLPWTVEAGEVLYQERLGKKSTCKTAAINLLSSEMIKSVIKRKGDVRLDFATEP